MICLEMICHFFWYYAWLKLIANCSADIQHSKSQGQGQDQFLSFYRTASVSSETQASLSIHSKVKTILCELWAICRKVGVIARQTTMSSAITSSSFFFNHIPSLFRQSWSDRGCFGYYVYQKIQLETQFNFGSLGYAYVIFRHFDIKCYQSIAPMIQRQNFIMI